MRFWDSSAVVPLIAVEAASDAMIAVATAPGTPYVWWGTRTEVVSALARREREDNLPPERISGSIRHLRDVAASWCEVIPSEALRKKAERLLRLHDLRAADSLQLAAALVACEGEPASAEFVCLDRRLRHAAAREGFRLLPPSL